MKKTMQETLLKFVTSRKLWAAVAASLPFALAGQWEQFAQVWAVYIGAQGVVDAAGQVRRG